MQGAQRSQQHIPDRRVAQNHVERVPPLGHGPLAQHLARGQTLRAHGLHILAGLAQQQNLAVHTRVEHLAEAVRRPGPQQGRKGLAHVLDRNIQTVFLPPVRHGCGTAEKRRREVQATHGQTLTFQQLGGKQTVQPAGKQRDNLRIFHNVWT